MLVFEIRCDGCDICGDSSAVKPAHVMRRTLAKHGWLVEQRGGKDFCPDCRPKEKR
jgi:hypothetical protein